MRDFLVQFQPKRRGAPSVASAKILLATFAAKNTNVLRFQFAHGGRREPYLNFTLSCRAADLGAVWKSLASKVFRNRQLGRKMRDSCITTCEGTRSWDNYLLLQHFDEDVQLDIVPSVKRTLQPGRAKSRTPC
jgi:hypothetical protein